MLDLGIHANRGSRSLSQKITRGASIRIAKVAFELRKPGPKVSSPNQMFGYQMGYFYSQLEM